ncbi:MAG: hypothetical protein AVDCRST_MAG90-367, partial [uncultured Microvirga sp.]
VRGRGRAGCGLLARPGSGPQAAPRRAVARPLARPCRA